jgi:DNA-binding HxlR family transcriptional regulator
MEMVVRINDAIQSKYCCRITEITEKSDRCLQFAFAVEDLYPEVLARKWTLSILSNLTTKEKVRFNELRKLMAGISNTVLSNRLLELEREDLISKKIYPEKPPKVEYSPTAQAQELTVIFKELRNWTKRYNPRKISETTDLSVMSDINSQKVIMQNNIR